MSKNRTSGKEGGDGRHRFVQTLISPEAHRALKVLALDKDVTLAQLLRDIIGDYLTTKSH